MTNNYRPIGRKHAKAKTWKLNVHKLIAMLVLPTVIVTCIELNYYYFQPNWNFIAALVGGVTLWIVSFVVCSWLDIK